MSDPTPRTPPRVRVVVLNWNAWWFTRRCLRALRATEHPADRLELVLVDNASVDGSLERLRLEFPDVRVVANPTNLGFAEGCNRAMRDLDDVDVVALVNNDAVVEPGWLAACLRALATRPDAGAAAARLVLEPAFVALDVEVSGGPVEVVELLVDGVAATSRTRFAGAVRSEGRTDWPLEVVHHLDPGRSRCWVPVGHGAHHVELVVRGRASLTVQRPDGPLAVAADVGDTRLEVPVGAHDERTELLNGLGTERNEVAESYDRHFGEVNDPAAVPELGGAPTVVPGFSGGGVALRAQMLGEVGLFDPSFFAYYEDSDLSWRAARAGWVTVTAPDAVIRHAFGGSGGARAPGFFFLNYRNWLLTVLRNAPPDQRRAALAAARARSRWAVRANVASPLRHGRRPDTALLSAWSRTWAGVADVRRRARRRPDPQPVGARATDRVHSAFQPRFGPRPPARRPGGPPLVALDLTDELTRPGAGVELVRALVSADESLDVALVRRSGTGQWSWVEPAQLARLLGVRHEGGRVPDDTLRFGALPPGTVVVRGGSDRTLRVLDPDGTVVSGDVSVDPVALAGAVRASATR